MIVQITMLITSLMSFSRPDTIVVSGEVRSVETCMPIRAATVTERAKKLKTFSDRNGHFSMPLNSLGTELSIEAPGFVSKNYFVKAEDASAHKMYHITIELLPKERQTRGVPFHQSEQKSFVLAEQEYQKAKFSKRIFRIVDRLTDRPVNGRVCLFFTKSLTKQCANLKDAERTLAVSLTERDIIAIEADANHYQKYFGNLILDNLDGDSREYIIKMDSASGTIHLPGIARQIPLKDTLIGAANYPEPEPITLYFAQSTYDLSEQSRLLLDTVALALNSHPNYRLIMTGHTDNVGRAFQNQVLSEYRVRVAYTYLTRKGVAPSRMHLSGKGEAYPAIPNLDETSRGKNRRIELEIIVKN
jgi:outer membrane protein OmpA-like peptidoglycan-associated protein